MEKRADAANVSADGTVLCLHDFTGRLELWDLRQDRLAASHAVGRDHGEPAAVSGGCVQAKPEPTGHRLLLYRLDGSVTELVAGVEGWNVVNDQIVASTKAKVIQAYDRTGTQLWTRRVHRAARSVAPIDDSLALGFHNGDIEVLPRQHDPKERPRKMSGTPSSLVYEMRRGPAGTLVASFDNGLLGVWLPRTGERLLEAKLLGVVHSVRVDAGKIYALTDIGDHITLDLGVLERDYCDLMYEVWDEVPVIWEDGRAVQQAPPADHQCAKRLTPTSSGR